MVQLIKPQKVQINTKDGEVLVHITMDLNLNLTGATVGIKESQDKDAQAKEAEEFEWQVPEFSSKKVKFGKEQKDER